MTDIKQLAEKIMDIAFYDYEDPPNELEVKSKLESLFREAMKCSHCDSEIMNCRDKIAYWEDKSRQAYIRAAEVARKHYCTIGSECPGLEGATCNEAIAAAIEKLKDDK